MTLQGISGANGINNAQAGQIGMNQGTDSFTQNIKRQIANLQKQLQELSFNEEMSMEDKLKKRQEISQEINNLNNQLRQHQIEQRKEKQEAQSSSADNASGSNSERYKNTVGETSGISGASMQALILADSSMQQVQVQSKVKTHMEGQAGVLQAEIKQDAALRGNTEAKEEKLAKLEDKINELTSEQMSALSEINKNLEKAVEEDQETKKTEKDYVKDENQDICITASEDKKEFYLRKASEEDSKADETSKMEPPTDYTPVDIRL